MAGNSDVDCGFSGDCFGYLIVRPEKGGVWDWMKYLLWGDLESGLRFLESSDRGSVPVASGAGGGEEVDDRWIIIVSIVVRKLLGLCSKPMELTSFSTLFLKMDLSQVYYQTFSMVYFLSLNLFGLVFVLYFMLDYL